MVIETHLQGGESKVEVYSILTEEELTQRLKKKTKKAQKKSSDAKVCEKIVTIVADSISYNHMQASVSLTAQEEVKFICSLTSSKKAKIR